ncbi:hypothetical protein [Ralstonia pickettii]|uniref:Uncharacterized protein n=1 Tax=Ralstonia pickettii TaxID=329 RepID=A0AAW4QA11_RALPI|nr:hypothetical protein [Ralstonia pickettii]MBA9846583.1 hypothetical protein [Ralstonia pickettii]MBA9851922.1 hypothetical protein [Ralstonia pickettii]MBA9919721.1 hypothetical protein [Ralstonia pickettii]MBA9958875.1 hypothetical protein [Ralstonia pickettii]MBA9965064.1 hypothetical protein [Ralstonia pickettii]
MIEMGNDRVPRIEGIPAVDGAYWYYKRGEAVPRLVQVGTRGGERVINEGPAIQRYWYQGEFFVGPIEPPFATPDDLANMEPGRHNEARYLESASGTAIRNDE